MSSEQSGQESSLPGHAETYMAVSLSGERLPASSVSQKADTKLPRSHGEHFVTQSGTQVAHSAVAQSKNNPERGSV